MALFGVLALGGAARADEAIYEKLLPSAAWVKAGDRTGTAVLVDAEKNLLVTNFHVVGLLPEVQVVFPRRQDGQVIAERQYYLDRLKELAVKGRVVSRDPRRDLAVVRVGRLPEGAAAVPLAERPPRAGQVVHTIGNPGASEALWVYNSGTVRQVYHKRFAPATGQVVEAAVVETQSPINPGDSGGPVVNDRGRLVGIAAAHHRTAALVGICIEAGEVRALLRGEIKSIDPAVREALGRLNLKYTVDDFGVFRLTGGDGHPVFVESVTEPLGRVRVREVWSAAYASEKPLPAALTHRLLLENRVVKIGAWEVRRVGPKEFVVFCARVGADYDPDSLNSTLQIVHQRANAMKKQLAAAEAPAPRAAAAK